MTGDSEVKRDLRKMKTAPQVLTERPTLDSLALAGRVQSFDQAGARRWITRPFPVARLDRLRAAGDVGGLAGWLAARGHYGHAAYQWTSYLPMVSPEGRIFR